MPRPHENLIGAGALVLAGFYSLTPPKRASQGRCRELCALHGPLPFNLVRSALVAGARYAVSCLGCTAALIVAMLVVGMSSVWWAVLLTVGVAVYKLSPELRLRHEMVLSLALMGLGVVYATVA
jgi:predicted metal-binding membrane protein